MINSHRWFFVCDVLLVLAMAAVWLNGCRSSAEDQARQAEAAGRAASSGQGAQASAPTFTEVGQARFAGIEGVEGPITLADGHWSGEAYVAGGASRPEVLLLDFYLSGDLDGDGSMEAVVLLNLSTGGTGQLLHLAVVTSQGDALENSATVFVGDRIQLRGGRIDEGRIILDVVRAGAEDAACCPGEVISLGWRLAPAGDLESVAVGGEPSRLSLAILADTEWVLRSWSSGEPAPEEPAVTLTYAEGQLAGHAGCNRYFASAQDGDMPGEIIIGPVGATKMACPDPQMAVENRFLAQLAGVTKYGFVVGRLALSYEVEGQYGTMFFER
jgi:heat shock protein HslJ